MSENPEDSIQKVSGLTEKMQSGRGAHGAQIEQMVQETVTPDKAKFDAALGNDTQVNKVASEEQLKTSLMDEIRNLHRQVDTATRATPEQLGKQVDTVIAKIDDLKTKLNTPNLEIKQSVHNILQNKLDHIDENLKVALDKAGLEYPPPTAKTDKYSLATPISRYLDYLTNGQERLSMLGSEVQTMGEKGNQFSAADMLAMQIKVGYVQQEIEFFTSLLNKALESTKTIMNVQV